MTPFYEGESEAVHLIRSVPELAGAWLAKAKRDRSKVLTRLFQPRRRQFLDGFITTLEIFLRRESEAPVSSHPSEGVAPPPPPHFDRFPAREQVLEPSFRASASHAEESAPILEQELADPGLVERAEVISPAKGRLGAIEAAQILFSDAEVDALHARESSLRAETEADMNLLAASSLDEVDSLRDQTGSTDADPEIEVEEASGIVRLSGWEEEPLPQHLPDQDDSFVTGSLGDTANTPPIQPTGSTNWQLAFEQAQGVGMVDLSAYDWIDHLGNLKGLIDQYQDLQNRSNQADSHTQ